jgi:hypothetical protein
LAENTQELLYLYCVVYCRKLLRHPISIRAIVILHKFCLELRTFQFPMQLPCVSRTAYH